MKGAKIPAVLWVMMVIVAVLSFLIGILVGTRMPTEQPAPSNAAALATSPSPSAAPNTRPSPEPDTVHRREAGDPMALGNVDAPVVIAVFSDLGCSYCAQWNTETLPQLMGHIDDGTVRIEWHDFPVTGPEAVEAAQAGRAAAAQARFFEFVDALYASGAELTAANFRTWAEEAGVPDLEKFEADRTGFAEEVAESRKLGAALELTGTPAFIVGEETLSGAQPVDVFDALINRQLEGDAADETRV